MSSDPIHDSFNPEADLLQRYIAGELAVEETITANELIEKDFGRGAGVKALKSYSASVSVTEPQSDLSEIWGKMSVRLSEIRSREEGGYFGWPLPRRVGYFGVIGTAFAVAAFAWQALDRHDSSAPEVTYTTYTTRAGQRASLVLGDGSNVALGPVTTLRVPKKSGAGSAIQVEGEALFTVRHASARAFTVVSQGVTMRVLGTEFAISAYDQGNVRVAVREGRISVQPRALTSSNAAIVTAGEVASVTPNNVAIVSVISDPSAEFAWASGDLVMRDVPIGEAFLRLSRWYGMEFQVSDPQLLGAEINATFPARFGMADMRNVARAIGARVSVSGNTVTFSLLK